MDPEATPPDPPKYRPLVPLGADREAILEAVVQGWLTPVGEGLDAYHLVKTEGTLVDVHLYDENCQEPIDLGELVRRMEERLGHAAEDGPNARPDLAIRLSGCRVDLCNCFGMVIRARFVTFRTCFAQNASFDGATFSDHARFDQNTFSGHAGFGEATFVNAAGFHEATFGNWANFRGTTFSSHADFAWAKFGDRTNFDQAEFGNEASFDQAEFGNEATFIAATFGNRANFVAVKFGNRTNFVAAKFGNQASFDRAMFGNETRFGMAKFSNEASFGMTMFGSSANFIAATFGDGAKFGGATLGNGTSFYRANIGDASFLNVDARSIDFDELSFGRCDTKGSAWWRNIERWFDWSVVRALGNLQILTRGSYASLVLVPVLAGVWRVLSAAVGRPLLPFSWVLTFFAAVALALGHTLYQVAVPQLIREKSRDDLISERLAEFAEDRPDRNDQLLRALDSLREVARRLPYERHPNFVRRHGRVVWLPSELEMLTQPRPPKKSEETSPEEPDKAAHATRPDNKRMRDVIDEGVGYSRAGPFRRAMMERMRTVIDEGARARYDLSAHDQMGWAWVAGGLYGSGIALIAAILLIQSVAVLTTATGWPPRYLWTAIGVLGLLLAVAVWQLLRLWSRRAAQPQQNP